MPDAPFIGTVGSIDERKGLTYFVEACARLHASHPAAKFVIVGQQTPQSTHEQSAYLRKLRGQADTLGLNGSLQFVPGRSDIPLPDPSPAGKVTTARPVITSSPLRDTDISTVISTQPARSPRPATRAVTVRRSPMRTARCDASSWPT